MIYNLAYTYKFQLKTTKDRWKENCKIKPELVTYLTSLGTVAIFSVLTVIIVLLSSPHHAKQECCSGKAKFLKTFEMGLMLNLFFQHSNGLALTANIFECGPMLTP